MVLAMHYRIVSAHHKSTDTTIVQPGTEAEFINGNLYILVNDLQPRPANQYIIPEKQI